MKAFKGTKGELEVVGFPSVQCKSFCVADFEQPNISEEEAYANAKIFAASQDLLEALKPFVDFPEEDLNAWIDEGALVTMTVQSRHLYAAINAINKAL